MAQLFELFFQAIETLMQTFYCVIQGGTAIGKLLDHLHDVPVQLRLLTGKHVDVGMLEIVENLSLELALEAGEESFGYVDVVGGKLLQAMRIGEGTSDIVQER